MAAPSTHGVTIRVFLVDGTPEGLRLVERPGWTGSLLAFARADYGEVRARPELLQTGVYVLLGPNPDGPRDRTIYVGEGDVLRRRLDLHQRGKDFWTHGYVLTTKDDSLNKAHARYLEARLLELAAKADAAAVDNGTAPPSPYLSEPEVAEMETYLDTALPLLSLVGVSVFVSAEESEAAALDHEADAEQDAERRSTRLHLKTAMTAAEGEDRSRGFLVFAGARGRSAKKKMISSYEQLRDQLLREGILVEEGDHVRLTKSYLFDSPSAAASVLSGGSKNGRIEWRDGQGRTLKELQEQTAR